MPDQDILAAEETVLPLRNARPPTPARGMAAGLFDFRAAATRSFNTYKLPSKRIANTVATDISYKGFSQMTCQPVQLLHNDIWEIDACFPHDVPHTSPLRITANLAKQRLFRCSSSSPKSSSLRFLLKPGDQWAGDQGVDDASVRRTDGRYAERIELTYGHEVKPGQEFRISYELRVPVFPFLEPFPERLICGQLLRSNGANSSPICSFRLGYPPVVGVHYAKKVSARFHSHELNNNKIAKYFSGVDISSKWNWDAFNKISFFGKWPSKNNQLDLNVMLNGCTKTIETGLKNYDNLPAFFKFGVYHNEDADMYAEWNKLTGRLWPIREVFYRNITIERGATECAVEIDGFEIANPMA